MTDKINYDILIEKSLKNVVVEALRVIENNGGVLPGEHYFYITFKTNMAEVRISEALRVQYPKEMTIVLQHQFYNLQISDKFFSVDLSFGGVLQTLVVPLAAVTYFADPYARFALTFNTDKEDNENIETNYKKVSNEPAEVVSIEDWKKGKKK